MKTGAQIAIFSILTVIFLARGSLSILRPAQLDGTLMVDKPEDGGTLLTLTLPLQPTRRLDMSEERLALDMEEIVAKQGKGDGANHV